MKNAVLWVDQYGTSHYAKTRKELQQKVGGRVSKMYVDKTDGRTMWIGYVVGQHWFRAYAPVEVEA